MSDWDDESITQLITLVNDGLSAGQIGERMNKSRNSIMSKIKREKLTFLRSHSSPQLHPRSKKPPLIRKYGYRPKPFIIAPTAPELPPEPYSPQRKTLIELEDGMCKWPIEQGYYCGVATERSYCKHHEKISYVKPRLQTTPGYRARYNK